MKPELERLLQLYDELLQADKAGVDQLRQRQDAPFHFGKHQPVGYLAKTSACKRSGPPLRWGNRFRNWPVVARLRGLSWRQAVSHA